MKEGRKMGRKKGRKEGNVLGLYNYVMSTSTLKNAANILRRSNLNCDISKPDLKPVSQYTVPRRRSLQF
jgi:hypothetical protein